MREVLQLDIKLDHWVFITILLIYLSSCDICVFSLISMLERTRFHDKGRLKKIKYHAHYEVHIVLVYVSKRRKIKLIYTFSYISDSIYQTSYIKPSATLS